MNEQYYWGDDPYWTDALETYGRLRTLEINSFAFDAKWLDEILVEDEVAYRLAEAMHSVIRHEGWDGHKGAPRLVMALFAKLFSLSVIKTDT